MSKPEKCTKCGSTHIVKFGRVIRAGGQVQRYGCKECGKIIVENQRDLNE